MSSDSVAPRRSGARFSPVSGGRFPHQSMQQAPMMSGVNHMSAQGVPSGIRPSQLLSDQQQQYLRQQQQQQQQQMLRGCSLQNARDLDPPARLALMKTDSWANGWFTRKDLVSSVLLGTGAKEMKGRSLLRRHGSHFLSFGDEMQMLVGGSVFNAGRPAGVILCSPASVPRVMPMLFRPMRGPRGLLPHLARKSQALGNIAVRLG
ncbi:hypothetical protein JD844_003972 [Phrynosoma platyrhinos]|uniref:Uncharacterized protein n=1 Tax=Phrynosoma platyrhinos TaxID=52577 RepID=A0ABQ7TLT1_PHRPL|nr:hypothetical protein JD844_003972 [Phrynosoma platyrhinos]